MAFNWFESFSSKVLQRHSWIRNYYRRKESHWSLMRLLYCKYTSKKLKFFSVFLFTFLSNYHTTNPIREKKINWKPNRFRLTYCLNYFQLKNLVSTEKLHPGAQKWYAPVLLSRKVRNFFPIFLPLSPTFSTGSSVPFYLTPLCPCGTAADWMEDNKLETIRRPPFATQHEHAFSFKARYRWVAVMLCARKTIS